MNKHKFTLFNSGRVHLYGAACGDPNNSLWSAFRYTINNGIERFYRE
jgi:hypothetical protein